MLAGVREREAIYIFSVCKNIYRGYRERLQLIIIYFPHKLSLSGTILVLLYSWFQYLVFNIGRN